jgi:hypothetical protein
LYPEKAWGNLTINQQTEFECNDEIGIRRHVKEELTNDTVYEDDNSILISILRQFDHKGIIEPFNLQEPIPPMNQYYQKDQFIG